MSNIEGLSSSQYAFRNNIVIQKYFYDEVDLGLSEPVYYKFKNKGRMKVANKFPDKIHSLDCFPRTLKNEPKLSYLKNLMSGIAEKLGFLNKDLDTNKLMVYLKIIYDNKYYFYDYDMDINYLRPYIESGKQKELEEMELDTRKYVWEDEHKTLSKSMKCKIMSIDRFKKQVQETTGIVFDAVQELLDSGEFIHNKLVADVSNLPLHTVERYVNVHKDEIDSHNRSVCGTDNYNDYLANMSMLDIDNAIVNLHFNKEKITIASVAKYANLHRNTVSRLNKVHNFIN